MKKVAVYVSEKESYRRVGGRAWWKGLMARWVPMITVKFGKDTRVDGALDVRQTFLEAYCNFSHWSSLLWSQSISTSWMWKKNPSTLRKLDCQYKGTVQDFWTTQFFISLVLENYLRFRTWMRNLYITWITPPEINCSVRHNSKRVLDRILFDVCFHFFVVPP